MVFTSDDSFSSSAFPFHLSLKQILPHNRCLIHRTFPDWLQAQQPILPVGSAGQSPPPRVPHSILRAQLLTELLLRTVLPQLQAEMCTTTAVKSEVSTPLHFDLCVALAINTTGLTSISVSFDAMTIRNPTTELEYPHQWIDSAIPCWNFRSMVKRDRYWISK